MFFICRRISPVRNTSVRLRMQAPCKSCAPVESTPLLAMSYWELVGVVLQALLLPYGGIHKP